jgi:K+/H+ antiporter YhaU regulatory subunit KhtT
MEYKLCAPIKLTDKELRQIADVLDCMYVVRDIDTLTYYFRKE